MPDVPLHFLRVSAHLNTELNTELCLKLNLELNSELNLKLYSRSASTQQCSTTESIEAFERALDERERESASCVDPSS